MSKAKEFSDEILKQGKNEKTVPKMHVSISDKEKWDKEHKNFKRANTNVGIMNRFILQFSRVEKAYRTIEEAFVLISRSKVKRKLQDRMKRRCKVKDIKPILAYLGYLDGDFSNGDLKKVFDKAVDTDSTITFQRLLIGVGLCYFLKTHREKEAKEKEKESSTGSEVIHDDGQADAIPPPDDYDDDKKMSDEDTRYMALASGFEVVKKMFDTIDEAKNGEISSDEFKQAFTDICRDPEIVEARMAELDYNNDKNISFREFIFGISSWVGFNDEMTNDEQDDDLDLPAAQSPKKGKETK